MTFADFRDEVRFQWQRHSHAINLAIFALVLAGGVAAYIIVSQGRAPVPLAQRSQNMKALVEAVRFYTLDHEQRMPQRWEDLELYLQPDPSAPSGVRAVQPDRQTLLNGQASVDQRVRAYLDRMSVVAEINSEVKHINIMTEEHTILVQEKNYDNRGHRIVGYSDGSAVDMTEVDKRTRWIEGQ